MEDASEEAVLAEKKRDERLYHGTDERRQRAAVIGVIKPFPVRGSGRFRLVCKKWLITA